MDNLLLLYILTLLVAVFAGMSIVLRILQSLPLMKPDYFSTAHVPASTQNTNLNKSTGFAVTLLFLIVLAVVFWFLLVRSQEHENTKKAPSTSEKEYKGVQGKASEVLSMDTYKLSAKLPISVPIVNQSPVSNETVEEYAIQIVAVSSLVRAERIVAKIGIHQPRIIEEEGMYKVVIAGFKSENAARRYQKYYQIKGFARIV